MRYVLSKIIIYKGDEIYRIYVTDALKSLGGLNARYADIVSLKSVKVKEDTRTPEEIIGRIRGKLNGSV